MSPISIAQYFRPKKCITNEEIPSKENGVDQNPSPKTAVEDLFSCNLSIDIENKGNQNDHSVNNGVETVQYCDEDDFSEGSAVCEEVEDEFRKWAEKEHSTVKTNKENMKLLVNKAVTFVEVIQKRLDNVAHSSGIKQPKSLKGKLLPYQLQGIDWMRRLYENGSHGMLADEMGLGKTIEVIGLLAYLREAGVWGPVLIIGPLSTIGNWVNEFTKWLPSVSVLRYHGDKEERKQLRTDLKAENKKDLMDHSVIVTSYEMVRMDASVFQSIEWFYLIVDEGHRLKNNECQLMQCLFTFAHNPMTSRLLLTGTPLQNNLKELWSLMHFLLPDVFTNAADFLKWFDYNNHNSESTKADIVNTLRKVVSPFFLRRVKSDIDVYLPRKVEIVVYTKMTSYEQELSDIVCSDDGRYDELIRSRNLRMQSTSRNFRMQIIRQLISHPYNVYEESEDGTFVTDDRMIQRSSKLTVLDNLLSVLIPHHHRVLVFVQFLETLHLLEDYCSFRGYSHCVIHGSTSQSDRDKQITTFQSSSDIPLFLLTTRSGGLGINLSAADTVILYDSDWNPQQDIQAMDRVHRLGQKHDVAVYRLITLGTLDVHLMYVAEEKRRLERMVTHHHHKGTKLGMLSFEEYLQLSKMNAFAGKSGLKPITKEETKKLALFHASKDLTSSEEGYDVLSTCSGNDIFGGINQDGSQVGKRASSVSRIYGKTKRIRTVL